MQTICLFNDCSENGRTLDKKWSLNLRTPPKYAALRLAWEADYVIFDVGNKNPDSSPASVIWERNYRDCIPQQRYTFCFNSLILYRVSVPGTICTPHQIPQRLSAKAFAVHRIGRFHGQSH